MAWLPFQKHFFDKIPIFFLRWLCFLWDVSTSERCRCFEHRQCDAYQSTSSVDRIKRFLRQFQVFKWSLTSRKWEVKYFCDYCEFRTDLGCCTHTQKVVKKISDIFCRFSPFFIWKVKASFWGILGLIPGDLIFQELKYFKTY